MSAILDRPVNLSGVTVYLIVGALVFAEDALFVGFLLPGETAAILGGVTTTAAIIVAVLAVAAVVNWQIRRGRRDRAT